MYMKFKLWNYFHEGNHEFTINHSHLYLVYS